jgi:hypothetical protein
MNETDFRRTARAWLDEGMAAHAASVPQQASPAVSRTNTIPASGGSVRYEAIPEASTPHRGLRGGGRRARRRRGGGRAPPVRAGRHPHQPKSGSTATPSVQPGVRRAVRGAQGCSSVPGGVGTADGGHERRGESVPEEDFAHAPGRLVREYRWSVRRLPVADRGRLRRSTSSSSARSMRIPVTSIGDEIRSPGRGRRPRGRPGEPAGDDADPAGRCHGQRLPRQAGHDDRTGQADGCTPLPGAASASGNCRSARRTTCNQGTVSG